jgi:heme exporter protein A
VSIDYGRPILLDAQSLAKRLGEKLVLRRVDLHVGTGEVVALLGPNGAGKTTLLRILATLTRPTYGEYRVFGMPAWEARQAIRRRIGVVGHQPYLYPELTCRENLRFFAEMYGVPDARRVSTALTEVGIFELAGRPASTLSRGQLQRLDLARTILHQPEVLMLDEPDTGLDAAGREILKEVISGCRQRNGCVIFTTHATGFALETAGRLVVLRSGSLVADVKAAAVNSAQLDQILAGNDLVSAGA